MFKGFFVVSFVLFGSIMTSAQEKQLPYELHAILPMTGYISFLGRTEYDTIELVEKTVNEQGGICLSPGIHPPADSFMFTASVSTYDTAEAVVRNFRLRGWT